MIFEYKPVKGEITMGQSDPQNLKGQNHSETYTFAKLPANLAELKELPEASLDSPFKTAALTVAALCSFEQNETAPYSFGTDNWATMYVMSGGADSPRTIKLRQKPSTGEWFLNEIQCLSDIRVPAAADPWA